FADAAFATAVDGITPEEGACHCFAHFRTGSTGRPPPIRDWRNLVPVLGRLRNMIGVIYLLDFRGVLGDEPIWLNEVREHIVAGTVPSDTPLDVESVLLY